MKKFLASLILIFSLIANSSSAKSLSEFVDFRKKVIEAKNENWRLRRATKEIAEKQKWQKNQLEPRIKETKDFELSLQKIETDFNSFDSQKSDEVEEIAQKIQDRSNEIKEITQTQDNISKSIENSRKLALAARNKTRELLAIRSNTESLYREQYGANFPQTGLDLIESRLKTQEQLSDIFQINNQVDEIEQHQLMGYSLIPQDNEEFYDPKQTLS